MFVPLSTQGSKSSTQFGMQGSDMIACSYGERMLNRVWSATADNHMQAQSSLKEAVQAFEEVASLIDNEREVTPDRKE